MISMYLHTYYRSYAEIKNRLSIIGKNVGTFSMNCKANFQLQSITYISVTVLVLKIYNSKFLWQTGESGFLSKNYLVYSVFHFLLQIKVLISSNLLIFNSYMKLSAQSINLVYRHPCAVTRIVIIVRFVYRFTVFQKCYVQICDRSVKCATERNTRKTEKCKTRSERIRTH